MELFVVKDYEAMSKAAALLIAGQVISRPGSVLGFATGSTPVGTYEQLAAMHKEGLVDFSRVTSFNLDEYYGVAGDNPCSYRRFMEENLFRHINIRREMTNVPDGLAQDVEAECLAYEEKIRQAGGIDLQLLGIGGNGHIGFNEPGVDYPPRTHLVDLDQGTIAANARFFARPEDVPRQALSMGIGSIMAARRIVLLANGEGKARAVQGMIEGPITPGLPASVLRLHPRVTVIIDKEGAGHLKSRA